MATPETTKNLNPRPGLMATLRNRRALIVDVNDAGDRNHERLHLVRVEYTDDDGPPDDTVIWEMEPGATIVPPGDLPRVDDGPPMTPKQFDALVRAARWSAMSPFIEPQGNGRAEAPIASPAFGAIQVDDFQIEPLLRALQMPRVSLLLADDVGLGKTIEAGLILTELLLRRRIRRVLILCPAALRTQWQQEMADKFSLTFDPVDRDATHALQKRLGLDANPWRTFPRIIASYHYLRQPEVLEAFLATCRARDDRAGAEVRLPWDLLIVDEAHNLMPSSFGSDSDLAKMLRAISPWFEHKLFLTATPHNGHTRSFTGLLEQLDPVRFTQTHEVTAAERTRISQVVVRRLKSEINALDDAAGRTRRFSSRNLDPLPLFFGKRERALNAAVEDLRREIKRIIATWPDEAGRAGHFAIEVLAKRLLSSPSTFAHSWFRFRRGIAGDEAAEAREVDAARRASKTELDDDAELEGRQRHAARVIGAWLQPYADQITNEMQAVDNALAQLGIEPRHEDDEAQYHVTTPRDDARFARLLKLIDEKLRTDRDWKADERLIVFTEYKATLDDLDRRLRETYPDAADRLLTLYGGLDAVERDRIKAAFNDPDHSVRILLATDAASEGLNLQNTARYVLHYEVPWNPARLEQRNGRLDRHGQARDVTVFHFTSESDADLRFIERVVQKVHDMRTDLGSLSEIFDAAFERRFLDFADDRELDKQLDADAKKARKTADVPRAETADTRAHIARVQRMRRAADLTPETLRSTLAVALGLSAPGADEVLAGPDSEGRFRLNVNALPQPWQRLVDDSLRLRGGAIASAMPGLVFDPQWFVRSIGEAGRPVFRPRADTVLLHLGHPVFHRALTVLARARFPQDGDLRASRWIARRGPVPQGAQGLALLTVEEMAVNDLRETFHHVVTTWQIPLMPDSIGEPLAYIDPIDDPSDPSLLEGDALDEARELFLAATRDVRGFIRGMAKTRTKALKKLLTATRNAALKTEKKRFKDRIAEVRKAMKSTTLARLQKQIDRERARQSQMMIPGVDRRVEEAKLRDLEAELTLRRKHYDELLDRLEREQTRVVEQAVPRRYTLAGEVRILPVAVEIRLPREGAR